jgi:hypothetical protein
MQIWELLCIISERSKKSDKTKSEKNTGVIRFSAIENC